MTVVLVALMGAGCVPGARESGPPEPPDVVGPVQPPPPRMGGTGGAGAPPMPIGPTAPGTGIFAGSAVSAAKAPPPVSGGTLLMLSDGKTAFASDPDRDALYLADLALEKLIGTWSLEPGDEPGRAVEDKGGLLHVVLRGGGAIATLDPRAGTLTNRRAVCPAPRGIAYDAASNLIHVACAGGELLAIAPDGASPSQRVQLDRDLRDVVVIGQKLFVSKFRSAEVLVVSAQDGSLLERRRPAGSTAANRPLLTRNPDLNGFAAALPGVAWRMRPTAGGAVMLHQESSNGELGTGMGGYGGGPCKGAMGAALSTFTEAGVNTTSAQLMFAVLPVDFAVSLSGRYYAVVAAGNARGGTPIGAQVYLFAPDQMQGDCVLPPPPPPPAPEVVEFRQPVGEAVAVAFDRMGRVVVQTREPARLEIVSHRGGTIRLSEQSRFDTGHAVFHAATSFGIACASCHPEGGDDGRVWRFTNIGMRRTQNLRGGILQTAPFHWDGEMRDLDILMEKVFAGRMGGPRLPADHLKALGSWMDRIPALPTLAPVDAAAVARGHALFNDAKVGCATCHTGPLLTNNQTVIVGTGPAVQVPSLRGLVWRAPYMHTGCAPTLADRFSAPCGGTQHGVTAHLTAGGLADLVAYLETL
jgi:mono/diheme cytochrome c family protein